jgi:Holliday junction resolvase RusA-like endonuclease
LKIELTYLGRPITKKNHQQIRYRKPRTREQPFICQSDAYIQYEADCIRQTTGSVKRVLNQRLNVRCIYFMPTLHRVDLGNLHAATDDILVKSGVLEDDNSKIVAGHDGSRVRYDKTNPRVEITITDMEEE